MKASSLSVGEKQWIEQGVAFGTRSDGRNSLAMRPTIVETGVLLNASGSAHVQRGATDVLAGVKMELVDGR